VEIVWEILTFEKMIAPIVLQLLFWAGVTGCVYGAWVLHKLENRLWPLPLLVGPLVVRVMFEIAILQFRVHDRLRDINTSLQNSGQT
jgi:hypothetical protein